MSENTANVTIISSTSQKLAAVTEAHAEIYNADELAILQSAVVELQAYEGLLDVDLPTVVDVPYAEQAGDTLSCTMGNWTGEPDSYAYRWTIDGVEMVGTENMLVVTSEDVGKTAVCVVTATNATGSTEAPPSNELVVTDPAA